MEAPAGDERGQGEGEAVSALGQWVMPRDLTIAVAQWDLALSHLADRVECDYVVEGAGGRIVRVTWREPIDAAAISIRIEKVF